MRNWQIKLIVVFMVLAMLGLVAIQINWIRTAVQLQEENFNFNVYRSLDKVVNTLEHKETMEVVTQAALLTMENVQFKADTAKATKQRSDQSAISSAYYIDPLQAIETAPPREIKSDKDALRSRIKQIADDTALVQSSFFASRMVQELLLNRQKTIPERINLLLLDSLIKATFYENKIIASYRYEIKHASEELLGLLDENNKAGMRYFGVRIFQNDFFEKPFYLVLQLERQTLSFFKNISNLLFLSIFTIIIIAGSFLYVINGLLKQKKLSEMKTDFVNNMTHELKTPIATISLASEALMDTDLNPNQERIFRYGKMIFDENQRLKELVERILSTSMFDKGGFNLQLETVSIHDVLQLVLEQNNLRFEERKAAIETQFLAETDIIVADPMHIMNVFYNIIDNSLKYSKLPLKINVQTKNQRSGVLIAIKDNGIGMHTDQQKRIFEKFYRVPTGDKHDVKGFGLGLTYVKKVVEAHGGYITVESIIHKGTTFFIFMPFNAKNA